MGELDMNELGEAVEAVKQALKKIEKRLTPIEPQEVEDWPKIGDRYWYVDSYDILDCCNFDNDDIDKWRKAQGNMFRTEAEAEKYKDYLEAVAVVKGDSTFKPDWNDKRQDKWFVYYDHERGNLDFAFREVLQMPQPVWFETQKQAKQSIKTHEAEWLKIFEWERR